MVRQEFVLDWGDNTVVTRQFMLNVPLRGLSSLSLLAAQIDNGSIESAALRIQCTSGNFRPLDCAGTDLILPEALHFLLSPALLAVNTVVYNPPIPWVDKNDGSNQTFNLSTMTLTIARWDGTLTDVTWDNLRLIFLYEIDNSVRTRNPLNTQFIDEAGDVRGVGYQG